MKLKTLILFIGLFFLFYINIEAQNTITLTYQPDATDGIDNTMLGGDRDTMNCGVTPEIGIGYFDDNSEERRILIKFTPLNIPNSAIITSAYITGTYDSKAGTPPGTCYVYCLRRSDWVEGTKNVTKGVSNWNQYKTASNWGTEGAGSAASDVYTSVIDSTIGLTWSGTDNIDVTNCVTKIVGNDSIWANNGFRISGGVTSGNNYGWWHSSDSAGNEPIITINYVLSGVLPKVYKSVIQTKVNKSVITPKVRSPN